MTTNKINLKHLPELWPDAINWQRYFHNINPVDLEIGCGRTHFFFDRADNFPERNIIGIEWKYEFIEQGQRRIIRENRPNSALFHGNAWLLVPMLFAPRSIAQIFVNFPDPWWKGKHKKRLVLNDVFLDALKNRMTADGALLLQTDVLELFTFYKNLLSDNGFVLDSAISEPDLIAQTQAKTHREKKCLLKGMPIFRGRFVQL